MTILRDDFNEVAKRTLAARVGNTCSNPDCRAVTSGPQDDPLKALNVGVAAHITGAAPGGPRYNAALTADQRSHPDNGIWLCQICAKLVDNDTLQFPEDVLRAWKTLAEYRARSVIGKAVDQGAMGERERSELIRQQTLALLTPVLVLIKREALAVVEYSVENHGAGVALAVKANYRGRNLEHIFISHNILGPNRSAVIALCWETLQADGMHLRYESRDGRFFVTTAFAKGLELHQTAFEVDAKGGYLSQPRLVPERTD
jgi:hypothetical protein